MPSPFSIELLFTQLFPIFLSFFTLTHTRTHAHTFSFTHSIFLSLTLLLTLAGGEAYNDRQVFSYHIYCAPTTSEGDPTNLVLCDGEDALLYEVMIRDAQQLKVGSVSPYLNFFLCVTIYCADDDRIWSGCQLHKK